MLLSVTTGEAKDAPLRHCSCERFVSFQVTMLCFISNTAPNKTGQTVSRNSLLANIDTYSAADKLSLKQECIKTAFRHLRC